MSGFGLPPPIRTIEIHKSHPTKRTTDLLEDCRYIGSYDWSPDAEQEHPIIFVPGSPNVWRDPKLPLRLKPDIGIGSPLRAYNDHVRQGQPLLPLLAAVDIQGIFPREDWKTVDFVTDRNGLRKLLRWIQKVKGRDFRIDTQLVGDKTVVFNRWEKVNEGSMSGRTYGFNFEKATTVPMPPYTKRSSWHHRIVTYKFGRFKMVVQFEVDACLAPSEEQTCSSEEDQLIGAMVSLDLSSQAQGMTSSASTSPVIGTGNSGKRESSKAFGLTIHHQGRANIPNSDIVEITTISTPRHVPWNDRYPQLYLSQTKNHHSGVHQSGTFHKIDKLDLSSPQLYVVHEKLQPAFKALETALGQIQSIVMEHGKGKRLSLVYEHQKLTVHRNPTLRSCFPSEALELFE